jgi:hypothetical protein
MIKIILLTGILLLHASQTFGLARNAQSHHCCSRRLVLWVWERPEDLRFIDPQNTAVAYLASSFFISAKGIAFRPRLQPLALAAGTERIAVVRIETSNFPGDIPVSQVIQRLVDECCELAAQQRVEHLQLDYDARVSERPFYRDFLTRLRVALPQWTHLSITALTSWCLGDPWIVGLPIDEAVPMAFRMGRDGAAIRDFMKNGASFDLPICAGSLGVSLDEMPPLLSKNKRLYVFNPKPWTSQDVEALKKEMQL